MSSSSCVNFTFCHPFTCVVAGPTGCGKSTFVRNLILNRKYLVDKEWDYICIFLGTSIEENPVLASVKSLCPDIYVDIIDTKKMFPDVKTFSEVFPSQVQKLITTNSHRRGCIIFDDLMKELAACDMLVNLFCKYSSHCNLSPIYITQNPFIRGKNSSDNTTVFRNTHVFVLFDSPMDKTLVRNIAYKIDDPKSGILSLFKHVLKQYRYIVIRGDLNVNPRLKFSSDIFNQSPCPNAIVFELDSDGQQQEVNDDDTSC